MYPNTNTDLTRRGFLGGTVASALTFYASQSHALAADAGKPDNGWQIGCWTRPWAKYDYRVAMDAVVEAGYKYISFTGAKTKTGRVIATGTSIEEAAKAGDEAKKRGLKISYVYGGGLPLHEGPEDLKKMIDRCAAARGRYVVISRIGSEKQIDHNCKVIAGCCDYATDKNVGLVIKPHGGLNATGKLCRRALEKVAHKNFTLLYDPGNVCYYSEGKIDPIIDAATVAGFISGMCVKDYRHPKNVMITPGTGQIDFPTLMNQLKKGGFTKGPLAVECLNLGSPQKTLEEAKKARRFVEELVGIA
ncbi:MAG: sugar phosphate isomerase/epimerase [Pirellulales bacterium]|nr:sugar phosphate isomerase/epimerase [Pirellulales bacterium]